MANKPNSTKAYKVKADTVFHKVIREVNTVDGNKAFEKYPRAFRAGEYVLSEDLTPSDRKRAENGELDHLLELADYEVAERSSENTAIEEDKTVSLDAQEISN